MKNIWRGYLRPLRLATGLVLFIYTVSHFINHAFGIRSIAAMEDASVFLLWPWQTLPGHLLLYGALLGHLGLGLYSLYRRRHLRIPASEAVQIALGLAIPILLIGHAAAIRVGEADYGLEFGYERVLYQLWVANPVYGPLRQYGLLFIVWVHGCLGVRAWLGSKPWYPAAVPALAALATLLPVLALLGFINAGLDMRDIAASDPALIAETARDLPGSAQAEAAAAVSRVVDRLTLGYFGLVAGLFALRGLRDWRLSRFGAIRVTYPGGRAVSVPAGYSVLEASRWGGIAHASVCGGRGRCSTCRVRIVSGGEGLEPPGGDERRLLSRIGAPDSVRLACQIRPKRDISVVPLVQPAGDPARSATRFDAVTGGGREIEIAALFVDVRQSTRLANDRLPYDALFLFDRYIQGVSAAVGESGGHVISIAGDGIMSIFGIDRAAASAVREAFVAALQVWDGIDALNSEMEAELTEPFRVGIGLHVGVAVVGVKWDGGLDGFPFLGDTGNVAAKLEAETKRLGCTMIASAEAVALIADAETCAHRASVSIAGKQEPVAVAYFSDRDELRRLLRASVPA